MISYNFKVGLVSAFVIAIAAAFAFGQTDAVFSVNVVGFQKITVEPNELAFVSNPFDPDDPDMNEVVGPQLTAGFDTFSADNIIFFDSVIQAFKSTFLLTDVGDPNLNFKWIDEGTFGVATAQVPPGVGFFVRNSQGITQSFVMVGDVVDTTAESVNIVPGLQMISYAFSAPIPLNNTTLKDNATSGFDTFSADNVIIFDEAQQVYLSHFFLGDVGDPNLNFKWIDESTFQPSTVVLEPGMAIWYRNRDVGSFVWQENKPYTL